MIGSWLRRTIPPQILRPARYAAWYVGFYLVRRAASSLVKGTARVHPTGPSSSDLAARVRGVNVFAPTATCRVMTKHGSDKGAGSHNYTPVYAALFDGWRDRPLRIFELGLGTNDPTIAYNMGRSGRPGASLRAWRDLFPRAQIFGADIDRAVLFSEDRIHTFYCDQLNRQTIRALWSEPDLRDGADVIIDDGLHTLEGNGTFLEESLPHLRPGGYYVVEDILGKVIDVWRENVEKIYAPRFPDCDFVVVELPNPKNRWDNNLLIVRRHEPSPR